jgi:voltage-gated potassium channel
VRFSSVRASFYDQLLGVCLALMACFALPYPWSRFASLGYLILAAVLIRGLGRPAADLPLRRRWRWGFPALGLTAVAFWLLWTFTPVQMRSTGIPVIVFWTVFGGWSTVLLIQMLARERRVNGAVLKGALAGYLMMGIAAGLLLCGLETIQPGSFRGITVAQPPLGANTTIWGLNFVELNYFAFVSLTTMGYGDVVPQTPMASMTCVMIAVAGTFYIAVVMGLLISRLTLHDPEQKPEA